MSPQESIYCFFPQVTGHGGIPRFNRNLIKVFGDSTPIHSLNDVNGTRIRGYNRNKLALVLNFIGCCFKSPELIVLGHINFLPFAFIAKCFGIKTVMILHGIEAWQLSAPKKKLVNFVTCYWAVSRYTQQVFTEQSELPQDRIKRIFNTLPFGWHLANTRTVHSNYFLTVTRLSKAENYKGIKESIEAVALLKDMLREKGWRFLIVAHGDAVAAHQQLTSEHNITDLVEFKGAVSDVTLKELYEECGFFILPSTGEGFGIVFLEAMAFSKACIGAKNCGSEDVIDAGTTGYLVDQSIDELATALRSLIEEPEKARKMGEAGHQKLMSTFTFDRFEERIKQLVKPCVE